MLVTIVIVLVVLALVAVAAGTLIHRRLPKPGKTPALPTNLNIMVDKDDFTAADKKNMKTVIIRWADISRVTVITTDQGPFVDDVFYHIVYTHGELTLPSEANGMQAFVDRLATLPGFDAQAFIAAMSSAENNSFSVVLSVPGSP